jgi:uncharacterized protein YndB with AHSA1/START domain
MKLTDITVSRTIPAPPERVFDAWLNPKAPGGPWHDCERVILQPENDGLFYHAVEHEGRMWAHYGRFIEVQRPAKIEHTWMSEATKGVESVVTVTLRPDGDATVMTIRHAGVPDDELGRQHEKGWTWIMEALEEGLTGAKT